MKVSSNRISARNIVGAMACPRPGTARNIVGAMACPRPGTLAKILPTPPLFHCKNHLFKSCDYLLRPNNTVG